MMIFEKCKLRIEKWVNYITKWHKIKDFQKLDYISFEYHNYASFKKYVIHYSILARKIFITRGNGLEKPMSKEINITRALEKKINRAHKKSRRLDRVTERCIRTIDGYHWYVKFKSIDGTVVEYKGYGIERNLWHQLNWKLIRS